MTTNPNHRIILMGADGQIGSALAALLLPYTTGPGANPELVAIDMRSFCNQSPPQQVQTLQKQLSPAIPNLPTTIIMAFGITNPSESVANIRYANVDLPSAIIQMAETWPLVKCLTLGTIQEHFPKACMVNSYLKSKLDLGSHVQKLSQTRLFQKRLLHLRLHTLYSQHPPDHMFLGQMARAIVRHHPFSMSAGTQLREYHHVDDFASTLKALIEPSFHWPTDPFLDISTGKPVRLADLARYVFQAFDSASLLQIGTLSVPPGENTETVFTPSSSDLVGHFREPLNGVTDVIRNLIQN